MRNDKPSGQMSSRHCSPQHGTRLRRWRGTGWLDPQMNRHIRKRTISIKRMISAVSSELGKEMSSVPKILSMH